MKDSEQFGRARTTNPASVGNNTPVPFIADDVGRQVMVPYQVRDLITTARVELTRSSETTLLAGDASAFNDLLWIKGINTSSDSISAGYLNVRDGTGAGIVLSTGFDNPAGGWASVAETLPVPIPQSALGNAWTVQLVNPPADMSVNMIVVNAIFIKNV